jgi:hypothetical protein
MTGTTLRSIAALVIILAVVACGSDSTSLSTSPAVATPGVTSPPAAIATPSDPPPAPTPVAVATDAPTPATLVLGGTWVRPKAGATLTSTTTTLSARPAASGPGETTFTKVVFSATWSGATKTVLCRATKPSESGAWDCRANLLALGVPPGKLTFTFDVYGEGVRAARSPDGPRRVTYAVPPPKPTDTHWEQIEAPDFESGDNTATYRLRWSAPAGYADEFLVYETSECPRKSKQNAGTPCFVAGTPVDVTELTLLAAADGDVRSVEVTVFEHDCDGHGTILLRARNAYGKSAFTMVEVVDAYWPDPNEVIC